MKKTLSMVLTVAMMFLMGVTVFAADLPVELPDVEVSFFDTIIDFFAGILRAIGEFIGVIFK